MTSLHKYCAPAVGALLVFGALTIPAQQRQRAVWVVRSP